MRAPAVGSASNGTNSLRKPGIGAFYSEETNAFIPVCSNGPKMFLATDSPSTSLIFSIVESNTPVVVRWLWLKPEAFPLLQVETFAARGPKTAGCSMH